MVACSRCNSSISRVVTNSEWTSSVAAVLDQLRALDANKAGRHQQHDDRREAKRQHSQNLFVSDRFGIHAVL